MAAVGHERPGRHGRLGTVRRVTALGRGGVGVREVGGVGSGTWRGGAKGKRGKGWEG